MVPLVTFASRGTDSVAAVLARLNAMRASTSHAELAAKRFRRQEGQGRALETSVDLLDDRVPAVGLVRGDGVQGAGGEERVRPPSVDQGGLPRRYFGFEVGDAADHQATGDPVSLTPGRERGELDLGDLWLPPSSQSQSTKRFDRTPFRFP